MRPTSPVASLTPTMLGKFAKPLHRVDRHVDDAARRDVVDDDRNADRVVDGPEVLVEPFLGRLVVIGRDDEHGVGAGALGVQRERDCLGRVVRARPRDHRNPAARFVDADVDGAPVFLVGQRRALAGRSDRYEPMRPGGDLPVDQRAVGLLVDLAVLERGHQGRHRTVKLRPLVHFPLPAGRAAELSSRSGRARTHRPVGVRAKGGGRASNAVNTSSGMSFHPPAQGSNP